MHFDIVHQLNVIIIPYQKSLIIILLRNSHFGLRYVNSY